MWELLRGKPIPLPLLYSGKARKNINMLKDPPTTADFQALHILGGREVKLIIHPCVYNQNKPLLQSLRKKKRGEAALYQDLKKIPNKNQN